MSRYILVVVYTNNPDGRLKFVGIDHSSGGYPYEVDTPFSGAKIWEESEVDEMLKYLQMFKSTSHHPGGKWEVAEIEYELTPRKIREVTFAEKRLELDPL